MQVPLYQDKEAMRNELFWFKEAKTGNPISLRAPEPRDLCLLANMIFQWPPNEKFDFHVVGSFPYKPQAANDIDISLTKKTGEKLTIRELEAALLGIRYFGLKTLGILLDVSFKNLPEQHLIEQYQEAGPFYKWRLDSPPRGRTLRTIGQDIAYREVGEFLLVKKAPLTGRGYFSKLPIDPQTGKRYLKEAVPLSKYRTV